MQDRDKGVAGAQGAVQMPTPTLDDLPASERGGATYSVQGGTGARWVLQLNTATKIIYVEYDGAFKEEGGWWFYVKVRAKEG